jgi:hypothetical protein
LPPSFVCRNKQTICSIFHASIHTHAIELFVLKIIILFCVHSYVICFLNLHGQKSMESKSMLLEWVHICVYENVLFAKHLRQKTSRYDSKNSMTFGSVCKRGVFISFLMDFGNRTENIFSKFLRRSFNIHKLMCHYLFNKVLLTCLCCGSHWSKTTNRLCSGFHISKKIGLWENFCFSGAFRQEMSTKCECAGGWMIEESIFIYIILMI